MRVLCVATCVVAWLGSARVDAQTITMMPNPIDLGDVAVGSSAMSTGTLTVNQNARVDLVISGCSGGNGTFTVSPDQDINLNGASASAMIVVTYMANGSGTRQCTVTAYPHDNMSSNYGTFTIRATGRQPPTLTTADPGTFTSVRWNDAAPVSSSTRNVTVTNDGDAQLMISAINFGGPDVGYFSIPTGSTPATIEPGVSRNFTVTFDPDSGGMKTATMTFVSNDPTGDKIVNLAGTGTNAVIDVPATPAMDFGTVAVGSTVSLDVPVANIGGMPQGPLTVSGASITASVNWISFSSCNGSTTPTQSCNFAPDLSIGGTPASVGVRCHPPTGEPLIEQMATVTFNSDTDNAASDPARTITVRCTPGASDLKLKDGSTANLGSHLVNGPDPGTATLTVTNEGTSVALVQLAISGTHAPRFTVAGTDGQGACGSPANTGNLDCDIPMTDGTLPLTFTFSPVDEGDVSATVNITGAGTPLGITLVGRGIDKHISVVEAVEFPETFRNPTDAQAAVVPVEVQNVGEYELTVNSVAFGDNTGTWTVVEPLGEFVVPPADPTNGPGRYDVMVRFNPLESGKALGSMVVLNNDVDNPMPLIMLSGLGKNRNVDMTPGSVDVGDTFAGVPTLLSINRPADLLTIANVDSEPFQIREIRVEGDDPDAFRVIDLTGATLDGRDLAPGASETVDIEFLPAHVGEFNATLVLYLDNDTGQTPIPIRGRALWVDARGSGGFGCSTGGSPRGLWVLALGALLAVRRRRW